MFILTMHVLFLLKLYKAITPWFFRDLVIDHFDRLDWPILFKFPS